MARLILCLVAAGALSASVAAAAPQTARPAAIAALDACRGIADGAARLACYDRAVPALTNAVSSGDVAVVDREQMRSTHRSLFGFTLPDLPLLRGSSGKGEPEMKKIVSTVLASTGLADGRYRITIADSNAVWETIENSDAGRTHARARRSRSRRAPSGPISSRSAANAG